MKRGFTLLEMAVVLAVLALVAHLAVASMDGALKEKRLRLESKQMEEIQKAVERFRRDMGRLPRGRLNRAGRVTISELWQCPDGVSERKILAAVPQNLAVEESERASLANPAIYVATGWNGPYLKLPAGRQHLADAWGNRMENDDDAGFPRLFTRLGTPCGEGDEIAIIRHYGADGRPGGDIPESADGCLAFTNAEGRIVLTFAAKDGDLASGDVVVRSYSPMDGAITGQVHRTSTPAQGLELESIPAGECVLSISTTTKTLAPVRVETPPKGGTIIEVKL